MDLFGQHHQLQPIFYPGASIDFKNQCKPSYHPLQHPCKLSMSPQLSGGNGSTCKHSICTFPSGHLKNSILTRWKAVLHSSGPCSILPWQKNGYRPIHGRGIWTITCLEQTVGSSDHHSSHMPGGIFGKALQTIHIVSHMDPNCHHCNLLSKQPVLCPTHCKGLIHSGSHYGVSSFHFTIQQPRVCCHTNNQDSSRSKVWELPMTIVLGPICEVLEVMLPLDYSNYPASLEYCLGPNNPLECWNHCHSEFGWLINLH